MNDFTYNDYLDTLDEADTYGYAVELTTDKEYDDFMDLLDSYGC